MPELPEVHRYSQQINEWAQGKVFRNCPERFRLWPAEVLYTICSETRGKEQVLTLTRVDSGEAVPVRFNHGLLGQWAIGARAPSQRFCFVAEDGSGTLSYVDVPNMAKTHTGQTFDCARSPDPINEFEAFRACLARHQHAKGSIGEAMLEQKIFNGVGNYLRSEV